MWQMKGLSYDESSFNLFDEINAISEIFYELTKYSQEIHRKDGTK